MQYLAPEKTAEAVKLLSKAKGKVHILAGGSDLLVRMKGGFIEPDVIIDIKRIKSMQEIKQTASGFLIGAAVSCETLGRHKQLRKAWPGVVEAANLIGSDQIQGRCTIAGNLCNASPAADSVPALIAAKAVIVVKGPNGTRRVAAQDIVKAPGKTSIKKGEVVESIQLPKRSAKTADAYLRFIPRTEMDIAVVSAAVNLTLGPKGVITDARVVLGAVAPTAILVPEAAKILKGGKLDDDKLDSLVGCCSAACKPIEDKRGTIDFRTGVAGVLAKRATIKAYTRAGGEI